MKNLVLLAAALLLALLVGASGALRADPLPGVTKGAITLTSATPSTATATVPALSICVCTNQTTQANPVKCAVSGTTMTATGPNTVTDVVSYVCL